MFYLFDFIMDISYIVIINLFFILLGIKNFEYNNKFYNLIIFLTTYFFALYKN